jgi:hypothetical protein
VAGTIHLLRRPAAGVAALAGTLALLAGCGGSPGTITQTQTLTVSKGIIARGPKDLEANLDGLGRNDYPQLDDFKARCPSEPTPPSYPVNCTMTAIDTSKLSDPNLRPDGAHRPVKGPLTVYGVYPATRTYVYKITYAPTKSG